MLLKVVMSMYCSFCMMLVVGSSIKQTKSVFGILQGNIFMTIIIMYTERSNTFVFCCQEWAPYGCTLPLV